ncbi:Hint domain-containing protein [Algicella marina]|uniref:Type I secretion protein n=1 Tax=Algicella marina TaxID=2683284 RepID=A0A6P1SVY7_9RHOB|nr:Hint domain-containing protein [Algicella marina]QHQ33927.1 type I secretion protein [Algicella marina]
MPVLSFYVLSQNGKSDNGTFDSFGGAPISVDTIDDFVNQADFAGSALEGATVGGLATVNLNGTDYTLVEVSLGGETYYAETSGFNLESLGTVQNVISTLEAADFDEGEGVLVCFVRGAMIETADGPRAVETLQAGDMVLTADNGYQPVRWAGSTRVSARGRFAPVRVKAGALGDGPSTDLLVSRKHRMLVKGWRAELLFGASEVLVTAESLINDGTIRRDASSARVEYFHVLFDRHELIWANGCLSESFNPSEAALSDMEAATRDEVLALFPALAGDTDAMAENVRMVPGRAESALLAPAH